MNGTGADTRSALERLFRPRTIAVVGASRTPGKPSYNVVKHLTELGYSGQVWPVNPSGGSLGGLTVYPSVADLPEAPDVAYLVVPGVHSAAALEACARRGTAAAIVGASGFAETGTDEGRRAEARLLEIARASGMRLVGPNTNGLVSAPERLALGFNRSFPLGAAHPGPVSIVSHSGALFDAAVLPLHRAGTGIARFLAVGNEPDLTMVEVLEWLAGDSATSVIGLVVESLTDAERFRIAARRVRDAGKRIVAIKVGRSEAGASAALAHSSRIAGSARAYDALFRDAGVTSAPTVEAFAAALTLHALFPGWDGARRPVVCVTTSGGGGALVADAAAAQGMTLAVGATGIWPEPLQSRLAAHAPAGPVRHPLDLGTLGDWSPLSPMLAELTDDVPGPLIAFTHTSPTEVMSDNLLAALRARKDSVKSPVVLLAPGGLPDAERYRDAGLPLFTDTATLVSAFSATFETPVPAPLAEMRDSETAHAAQGLAEATVAVLDEAASARILSGYGVGFAPSETADSPDDAAAAATRLGFPVALKGLSPGVAHKAAAGLVRLHLGSAEEVAQAARAMDAGLFLIQRMQTGRVEAIAAVTRDPQLGPFLLFGPGGVDVERSGETVMTPFPVGAEELRRLIRTSPLGERLAALPEYASETAETNLATLLAALGSFALAHPHDVKAAEVNPVIVTGDGTCIGVDALIERNDRPE